MKGIQYVVDDKGERRAVMIDLEVWGDLWEDFYVAVLASEREDEPRESLAEVKERLGQVGA